MHSIGQDAKNIQSENVAQMHRYPTITAPIVGKSSKAESILWVPTYVDCLLGLLF
jgi:hypothetical protein